MPIPLASAGLRLIPDAVGKSSRFAVRALTTHDTKGETMVDEGPILVRFPRRWVIWIVPAIVVCGVVSLSILATNAITNGITTDAKTISEQNNKIISLLDRFDATLSALSETLREHDERITRLERAERIRKEQGK